MGVASPKRLGNPGLCLCCHWTCCKKITKKTKHACLTYAAHVRHFGMLFPWYMFPSILSAIYRHSCSLGFCVSMDSIVINDVFFVVIVRSTRSQRIRGASNNLRLKVSYCKKNLYKEKENTLHSTHPPHIHIIHPHIHKDEPTCESMEI